MNSAPATLYLTDGTTIHDGTLSIGCYGTVDIETGKGATLDDVSVWNNGTITFGAANAGDGGDGGQLGDPNLVIGGTVTLQGEGNLILAGSDDNIIAARDGGELVNDSNIVGAGHIGNGSESLTLDNEACGTIDANRYHETLVIDTGHRAIDNDGLQEASCGGDLLVKSTVDNFWGSIQADAGSKLDLEGLVLGGAATIAGGTLIYAAALGVETSFANDTPGCYQYPRPEGNRSVLHYRRDFWLLSWRCHRPRRHGVQCLWTVGNDFQPLRRFPDGQRWSARPFHHDPTRWRLRRWQHCPGQRCQW